MSSSVYRLGAENLSAMLCPCSLQRSLPVDRQVSLIKDQVEMFTLKGLSCFYANSSDQEAKHSVLAGKCQFLYISSETLLTDRQWREILKSPVVQYCRRPFLPHERSRGLR